MTTNKQRQPFIKTLYNNYKERKNAIRLDEQNLETLERFLPFEKNQKRKFARVNLQTILDRYDKYFDQYEQYNRQVETLLTKAGCDVTAVKILSSGFSNKRIQVTKQDQTSEYYCYNGVMDSTNGLLTVDPKTVSKIQEVVTDAQAQLEEFIDGSVLSSTTNRFRIELTINYVNIGTFLDEMMHQKNFELIHFPHHSQLHMNKIGPRCQSYLEKPTDSSTKTGLEQITQSIYVYENQLPTYLKDPQLSKTYRKEK